MLLESLNEPNPSIVENYHLLNILDSFWVDLFIVYCLLLIIVYLKFDTVHFDDDYSLHLSELPPFNVREDVRQTPIRVPGSPATECTMQGRCLGSWIFVSPPHAPSSERHPKASTKMHFFEKKVFSESILYCYVKLLKKRKNIIVINVFLAHLGLDNIVGYIISI